MSDLEVEICEISVMAIYILSPRRPHVIMIKMAGVYETLTGNHQNKAIDSCEDLDKILSVVVKRRKTIPAKCMKINKQLYEYDISRLENAKVITEEDINMVKFKSTSKEILQGFKELKSTPLTLDDIQEAEEKLRKLYERAIQINSYLEKRKKLVNNF